MLINPMRTISYSVFRRTEDSKRPRRATEATSINAKIEKSKISVEKLKTHIENNTCPKTLRYNACANIAPDDEFNQRHYVPTREWKSKEIN